MVTATETKKRRGRPRKEEAAAKAVTTSPGDEEQLQLLDVDLPEVKEIKSAARAYRRAQQARLKAGAEEMKYKGQLLEVVKAAQESGNIKPDEDGAFKVKVGDLTISVTPRDELVRVRFDKDDNGD